MEIRAERGERGRRRGKRRGIAAAVTALFPRKKIHAGSHCSLA